LNLVLIDLFGLEQKRKKLYALQEPGPNRKNGNVFKYVAQKSFRH